MPAPADLSADPPNGPGSPDRYRAILHHGQQGFGLVEVLFDAQGAAVDFRVLEVNAAFERQTGLTAPVGRTLRELAPGPGADWFARYGEVARTGQPQQFEQQVPPAGGRWFEVQAVPGGPAGSH